MVTHTHSCMLKHMSQPLYLWMNHFRPTFLRLVTTHLLIPAALWPFGPFVNGGMGQTLALTNCWPGRTFMSAWLHVTSHHPSGYVGSRADWGLLCTQSQGTPVHASRLSCRVTAIVPQVRTHYAAFSHCEVVWEKHSSLDPGENSIRTSQTRACVLVQTVVTGLAAVSLLRHARLAVIIWQFKEWKEMNVWIEKNSPFTTIKHLDISSSSCFLPLSELCWMFGMCCQ